MTDTLSCGSDFSRDSHPFARKHAGWRARTLTPLCLLASATALAQPAPQTLDSFDDPATWRVNTSNQVSAQLRSVAGVDGKALCLDYDFNGVSGHAGIQRDLPLDYPANYQFQFQLRGDSPANDLQFKLIDASGDNVWWVNRPRYDFPRDWTTVTYKRRHIDKAWGPSPERELRNSARIEFTIYNAVGGKGSVCFDNLTLQALPAQDTSPLRASATAAGTMPDSQPASAVDGRADRAWGAQLHGLTPAALTLDLGSVREFGGLVLDWRKDRHAARYRVETSIDGQAWTQRLQIENGNGGRDYLPLPETEARYLRLWPQDGPWTSAWLDEARVQPLAFAASTNDMLKAVAADASKGRFPRGFVGEQPYWTIVGIDGGYQQGLIGEDGAIELNRGGPSIAPFVQVGDASLKNGERRWVSWADATASQSLQDRYLPIPSVHWQHPQVQLTTTAFAQGEPGHAQLVARYRLSNPTRKTQRYTLALALQPWQVNPPSQFLNTPGGYSPIRVVSVQPDRILIDGKPRVYASIGEQALATDFPQDLAVQRLDELRPEAKPVAREASDAAGLASAAWAYTFELAPGASREFSWWAPLEGDDVLPKEFDAAQAQARVAAQWHDKLDRVQLQVPAQGQALVDTLRTSLAHMLISRIGPRLQPGTRSYSRSWIRDGAMISEGLLRMGRDEVAREYVEWFAPYQFKDGMVPCCVDDRGSDPVPENDSHGELIYAIAEYYRYTGDRKFLRRMWPHVQGAFAYMEQLRASERTAANRATNAAFYGMMPVSISHEGYSSKPVHSYWDNFWALRGYKDAAEMALLVGSGEEQRRMAAARDQFRTDLQASLLDAARQHGIDFLPGSVEHGDFDATSTTIGLAPGGEQGRLPESLLHNTFERYWQQFVERRDGQRAWKDYTPYEWRNVAAFARLGWRDRAWEAIDFFFGHRTPQAWNQWAEVISHTPRTPFFLGDLPHAWVGSDFVRSALELFAYSRELDDSIVLAAGVPSAWLEGEGIRVAGLRTPQGVLAYSLRREGDILTLEVDEGIRVPKGGLILPWPYRDPPGATTVNGQPSHWVQGELRIASLPAVVTIQQPAH